MIAPNERERRIDVGYGLEGDIPDITAYQLGKKDLVPAFREGDYFAGLDALVMSLSGVVAGTYTAEQIAAVTDTSGKTFEDYMIGLFMLSFLSIFLASFVKPFVEEKQKSEKERASYL